MIAWLVTTLAHAGDPCPIDFRISNLGPLPTADASFPSPDPVWTALLAHARAQECTSVVEVVARDGMLPAVPGGHDGLLVSGLQSLLVDKTAAFRCQDAHVALLALQAVGESGHVVYQRGSRRVLLSTAGWGTSCMDLAELETGGAAALARLWAGATDARVADRHANP